MSAVPRSLLYGRFPALRAFVRVTLVLALSISGKMAASVPLTPKPDSLTAALRAVRDHDRTYVDLLCRISEEYRTVNSDSAIRYANLAMEWSEIINYSAGKADVFRVQGLNSYFIGDYEEATRSYLQALKAYQALGNRIREAEMLNLLGTARKKLGHDDQALDYFLRGLKVSQQGNDLAGIANAQNNIGIVYENKGDFDTALEYYTRSLATKEKLGDKNGITYNLNNIGTLHSRQGNYKEAMIQFQKALQMRKELGDRQGIAIGYCNIAELYLEQKRYDSAAALSARCLDIATAIRFNDLTQYCYEIMARAQEGLGNYEKAYRYHLLHTRLKDSLFTEKNARTLAEMEAKYETGRQRQELDIQALKLNEQNLELSKKRSQLALALGSVVVMALAGLLLYHRQQVRQRENLAAAEREKQKMRLKAAIEGEEKERKRLAIELHDGLGQVLSTARLNLSNLEDRNTEEPGAEFIENAIGLIDDGIAELREISHNLMPSALIRLGLIAALKEFTEKINKTGAVTVRYHAHGFVNRLEQRMEIALYRVIQEIVNNALKYAQAKEIILQVILDKHRLNIMIEDNGIGLDPDRLNESGGIGWENIRSRVSLLAGTIETDAHAGKGTSVSIEIPVSGMPETAVNIFVRAARRWS